MSAPHYSCVGTNLPTILAALMLPLSLSGREANVDFRAFGRGKGAMEMGASERKALRDEPGCEGWSYRESAGQTLQPDMTAKWTAETRGAASPLYGRWMPPEGEEGEVHQQSKETTVHEEITALYDRYYPRIYRYLQSLRVSADEIDEVIQEVFLRLTTRLLAGDNIVQPQGWVIRVAHNLAIDLLQRRSRHEQVSEEEQQAFIAERPDPSPNQEQQYLEQEQMRRLEEALSQLELRDRQCFVMRSQGMSYKDIAAAMKVTEQRAGAIVNKVAMRLAVIL